VLVVGAGEAGELAIKSLVARGARSRSSPTARRARRRAHARFGGEPLSLDAVADELARVDVVLSSTARRLDPRARRVERALHARRAGRCS
jgi:glutamyl-tRNA reductase